MGPVGFLRTIFLFFVINGVLGCLRIWALVTKKVLGSSGSGVQVSKFCNMGFEQCCTCGGPMSLLQ